MGNETREVLLGKSETTYNRDPGLSAGTDAIMVSGLSIAISDVKSIDRSYVSPAAGSAPSIYAAAMRSISFKLRMKGSGVATTPPEAAVVLKAAGFTETVGASNVSYSISSTEANQKSATFRYYEDGIAHKLTGALVEKLDGNLETTGELDVTITGHAYEWGTAQAGAASSITLDANHAAVDSIYNGQKIRIIAGTGVGQSNVIATYTGSTKVATVTTPWTTVPDATSVYAIDNGPIDMALPAPTYDSTVEPPVIGMPFKVGSYSAVVNSVSFSTGIKLTKPGNIASPDGIGRMRITGRQVTGSIEPELDSVAVKDWEAEWKSGTASTIETGLIGMTAGNQYQVQLLRAQQNSAPGQGSRDGIRTRKLSFACDGRSADGEIVITFS